MGQIKLLPEDVCNKIAAGEVVERPASVVKELVENALDAGARQILVGVEKAGRAVISVADDGRGMDADDALLCLEPHATSKIREVEDILRVTTLGFRGEALPSIASVSRLRLRTRLRGAREGTEVVVESGVLLSQGPVGCAPGTEMLVRDLFHNVPARRKFLKSDATEESHIQEIFALLAIAHPAVAFELRIDGRLAVSVPPDETALPRLALLMGKGMIDNAIAVDHTEDGLRVSGFVSKPHFSRTSRRDQRVFVNGRPLQIAAAHHAIREAYGTSLMKGAYPLAALFIEMDPAAIDVNVHPAKREARFKDERGMGHVIERAVRQALSSNMAPPAAVTERASLNALLQSATVSYAPVDPAGMISHPELIHVPAATTRTSDAHALTPSPMTSPAARPSCTGMSPLPAAGRPAAEPASGAALELPGSGPLKIIGFFGDTYLLVAAELGLLVIDQHAAHARILFERLLRQSRSGVGASQTLLIPVTVELGRADVSFLMRNLAPFEAVGFRVEPFGEGTALVTAIPPELPLDNVSGMVTSLVAVMRGDTEASRKGIDEVAVAAAACKLAVKANQRLSTGEAEALIRRLALCELPFTCPHGRPTVINISLSELEKRFGRRT